MRNKQSHRSRRKGYTYPVSKPTSSVRGQGHDITLYISTNNSKTITEEITKAI